MTPSLRFLSIRTHQYLTRTSYLVEWISNIKKGQQKDTKPTQKLLSDIENRTVGAQKRRAGKIKHPISSTSYKKRPEWFDVFQFLKNS